MPTPPFIFNVFPSGELQSQLSNMVENTYLFPFLGKLVLCQEMKSVSSIVVQTSECNGWGSRVCARKQRRKNGEITVGSTQQVSLASSWGQATTCFQCLLLTGGRSYLQQGVASIKIKVEE